jgi:hypothetical protein
MSNQHQKRINEPTEVNESAYDRDRQHLEQAKELSRTVIPLLSAVSPLQETLGGFVDALEYLEENPEDYDSATETQAQIPGINSRLETLSIKQTTEAGLQSTIEKGNSVLAELDVESTEDRLLELASEAYLRQKDNASPGSVGRAYARAVEVIPDEQKVYRKGIDLSMIEMGIGMQLEDATNTKMLLAEISKSTKGITKPEEREGKITSIELGEVELEDFETSCDGMVTTSELMTQDVDPGRVDNILIQSLVGKEVNNAWYREIVDVINEGRDEDSKVPYEAINAARAKELLKVNVDYSGSSKVALALALLDNPNIPTGVINGRSDIDVNQMIGQLEDLSDRNLMREGDLQRYIADNAHQTPGLASLLSEGIGYSPDAASRICESLSGFATQFENRDLVTTTALYAALEMTYPNLPLAQYDAIFNGLISSLSNEDVHPQVLQSGLELTRNIRRAQASITQESMDRSHMEMLNTGYNALATTHIKELGYVVTQNALNTMQSELERSMEERQALEDDLASIIESLIEVNPDTELSSEVDNQQFILENLPLISDDETRDNLNRILRDSTSHDRLEEVRGNVENLLRYQRIASGENLIDINMHRALSEIERNNRAYREAVNTITPAQAAIRGILEREAQGFTADFQNAIRSTGLRAQIAYCNKFTWPSGSPNRTTFSEAYSGVLAVEGINQAGLIKNISSMVEANTFLSEALIQHLQNQGAQVGDVIQLTAYLETMLRKTDASKQDLNLEWMKEVVADVDRLLSFRGFNQVNFATSRMSDISGNISTIVASIQGDEVIEEEIFEELVIRDDQPIANLDDGFQIPVENLEPWPEAEFVEEGPVEEISPEQQRIQQLEEQLAAMQAQLEEAQRVSEEVVEEGPTVEAQIQAAVDSALAKQAEGYATELAAALTEALANQGEKHGLVVGELNRTVQVLQGDLHEITKIATDRADEITVLEKDLSESRAQYTSARDLLLTYQQEAREAADILSDTTERLNESEERVRQLTQLVDAGDSLVAQMRQELREANSGLNPDVAQALADFVNLSREKRGVRGVLLTAESFMQRGVEQSIVILQREQAQAIQNRLSLEVPPLLQRVQNAETRLDTIHRGEQLRLKLNSKNGVNNWSRKLKYEPPNLDGVDLERVEFVLTRSVTNYVQSILKSNPSYEDVTRSDVLSNLSVEQVMDVITRLGTTPLYESYTAFNCLAAIRNTQNVLKEHKPNSSQVTNASRDISSAFGIRSAVIGELGIPETRQGMR